MDQIETDSYAEIEELEQFQVTDFDNSVLAADSELDSELQLQAHDRELDSELQSEPLEYAPVNSEAPGPAESAPRSEIVRFTRLPLSRIKSIMKLDPDVGLASAEAVFLVAKATELFLETIAKEAYVYTAKSKKKTVTKKDLDTVIDTVDALCFLDGAMEF